jgi:hypothetical protein
LIPHHLFGNLPTYNIKRVGLLCSAGRRGDGEAKSYGSFLLLPGLLSSLSSLLRLIIKGTKSRHLSIVPKCFCFAHLYHLGASSSLHLSVPFSITPPILRIETFIDYLFSLDFDILDVRLSCLPVYTPNTTDPPPLSLTRVV